MEQHPDSADERARPKQKQKQVKSHSNWPHILLLELAHTQFSGIMDKGCLHSLTSESEGRFLVNNILMFS